MKAKIENNDCDLSFGRIDTNGFLKFRVITNKGDILNGEIYKDSIQELIHRLSGELNYGTDVSLKDRIFFELFKKDDLFNRERRQAPTKEHIINLYKELYDECDLILEARSK